VQTLALEQDALLRLPLVTWPFGVAWITQLVLALASLLASTSAQATVVPTAARRRLVFIATAPTRQRAFSSHPPWAMLPKWTMAP
jgi:hypothetical protein